MLPKYVFTLAWVWMIIVGGLLITPHGVICIACGGVLPSEGYIGNPAVMILGLGALVLGAVGLMSSFRSTGVAP